MLQSLLQLYIPEKKQVGAIMLIYSPLDDKKLWISWMRKLPEIERLMRDNFENYKIFNLISFWNYWPAVSHLGLSRWKFLFQEDIIFRLAVWSLLPQNEKFPGELCAEDHFFVQKQTYFSQRYVHQHRSNSKTLIGIKLTSIGQKERIASEGSGSLKWMFFSIELW